MALLFEVMSVVVALAIKPFWLFKLSCLIGVRSLCVVIQTCTELLRAAVYVHLMIIWWLMIWVITILSLPVRLLTALRRERQLEIYIRQLQFELENLAWDRKELREQLQVTIKDCRMMEVMLAELEDEHDEAIVKIEQLEGELQDLKDENQRLKEDQGKSAWSNRGQGDESQIYKDAANYEIRPWKDSHCRSGIVVHEIKLNKDVWDEEDRHPTEVDVAKAEPEAMVDVNHIVNQTRDVALYQSIFSATLTLLVGTIVREAEDGCIPLVAALFTVVGISLKSAAEFFLTMKDKPASDAVALLSLNWFILGTSTYPMLPRVAHTLAPLAQMVSGRALRLLGLSL